MRYIEPDLFPRERFRTADFRRERGLWLFRIGAAAVAAIALCNAGCRSAKKPEEKPASINWRPVGTWSGRGNAQTDSFEIGFERCRIRWETRNETPPGSGTLVVTVNSAVSGRELQTAVDHKGIGQDIAYVSVDPHFSYLVINSQNLDWTVTVEEPAMELPGSLEKKRWP